MNKQWLNNRIIILTGASSGIGLALASEFIQKHNCKIIGVARNIERLEKAKTTLGDNFSYYSFDTSVRQNWIDFKEKLIQEKIMPDIIFNNAGYLPKFQSATKSISASIDTMNINYFSAVYSLELIDLIKQSDAPAIINVSSSASLASIAGISAYCASKSAVRSFTEALALEQNRMYVGYIMPGCCKTQLFNQSIKNQHDIAMFNKIASTPQKFAKKLVKRVAKKKRRTVIGLDAKAMDIAYRFAPCLSLKIISKVIKKAKLADFNDIYED